MIKSIELKNIQSHEETKLEFDSGVNCIVGSSNNGKSAILRGLYWARYNRPLGIDTLASHWNLDEKGNLKDEMFVKVVSDNGTVIRTRTKTENQYFVNDKELNVVKSDVPAEVEKALALSETSIQKQLDEPFLLSKSSGEVAKYFNHVVRLDVIDKVLTNAETTRRKTKQGIESLENQIEVLEEKKVNFDWIDDAEIKIIECKKLKETVNDLQDKCTELESELERYEFNSSKQYDDFEKQKLLISKIEKKDKKIEQLYSAGFELSNSVSSYEKALSKIYKSFDSEKKLISDIENKQLKLNESLEISLDLNNEIEKAERLMIQIKKSKAEIKELKGRLPELCPLCGKPFGECNEKR